MRCGMDLWIFKLESEVHVLECVFVLSKGTHSQLEMNVFSLCV